MVQVLERHLGQPGRKLGGRESMVALGAHVQ